MCQNKPKCIILPCPLKYCSWAFLGGKKLKKKIKITEVLIIFCKIIIIIEVISDSPNKSFCNREVEHLKRLSHSDEPSVAHMGSAFLTNSSSHTAYRQILDGCSVKEVCYPFTVTLNKAFLSAQNSRMLSHFTIWASCISFQTSPALQNCSSSDEFSSLLIQLKPEHDVSYSGT